ncbi:MAG TPA: ABC transporter substrate-binding protein [Burkholderiales bacterium]|nr:ABC transporter substrate-binding protein [Burkholderiales bacterium]
MGVLVDFRKGDANLIQMLSARLAAGGLIEGRDVQVEILSNELDLARIPDLAQKMVSTRPDVIYTTHEFWVEALQRTTSTIPIVFSSVTEPVERGFVRSFARSGTNIVGVADRAREMMVKRIQLLREALPRSRRLMVLGAYSNLTANDIAALEAAAGRLKFTIIRADITETPVAQTLANADRQRPDAILPYGTLDVRPGEHGVDTLFGYVSQKRIPVVFSSARVVERGGLMSLTEDPKDSLQRSADLVVKILKGARPSEMPIEQADKFELVINLKAAKEIGLTIPASILRRADRLIE